MTLSQKSNAFVRDHLAELRTELANRRTLLSHVRTALAFLGGGIALIHFSGHPFVYSVGWLLLPVGTAIFIQGVRTYIKISRAVREEKQKTDAAEEMLL